MAILVILVLGILWAAVLLPPILRSRNESGAPGGIGDFVGRLRSGLGHGRGPDSGLPPLTPIMGPVGGIGPIGPNGNPLGPVTVPGAMSPAQRRRRDVLVGLLGAAGLTFLMALFAGSVIFWVLHLLADALVGGYVYMLLQLKAKNVERRPATMPAPRRARVPGCSGHDADERRAPLGPPAAPGGCGVGRGRATRRHRARAPPHRLLVGAAPVLARVGLAILATLAFGTAAVACSEEAQQKAEDALEAAKEDLENAADDTAARAQAEVFRAALQAADLDNDDDRRKIDVLEEAANELSDDVVVGIDDGDGDGLDDDGLVQIESNDQAACVRIANDGDVEVTDDPCFDE